MEFKQETLRQTIEQRGETLAGVARQMGKHPSALNRYVTGRREPSMSMLVEILFAAGLSADEIRNTTFGEWLTIADNGN